MKSGGIKGAVSVVCLMLAFVAPVRAADAMSHDGAVGGVQAKAQYCGYCHGGSLQGYRGYYPIPRLAGQQPEYIVNQLRAFIERRRDSHLKMRMFRVHGVGPAMQSALAARFKRLDPKPYGSGPTALMSEGKRIFEDGLPATNVPACAACHGPQGQGFGVNPRLAGQLYAYSVKNLANWDRERGQDRSHPDSSAVMAPIARSMTKSQIEAVSAYMSGLR